MVQPTSTASTADKLSAFPITQQIVGVAGMGASAAKFLLEPFKALGRGCETLSLKYQIHSAKKFISKLDANKPEDLDTINHTNNKYIPLREEKLAILKQVSFFKNEGHNVVEFFRNALRATPVAGTIYSSIKWVNSDEPTRKATAADKASAFPIAQQVVGLSTVISNVFKLGADAFIGLAHAAKKAHLQHQINQLENTRDDCYDETELNVKIAQLRADIAAIPSTKAKEHLEYVGIGLVRLLPIIGTIYSSIIWARSSKVEKLAAHKEAVSKALQVHVEANYDATIQANKDNREEKIERNVNALFENKYERYELSTQNLVSASEFRIRLESEAQAARTKKANDAQKAAEEKAAEAARKAAEEEAAEAARKAAEEKAAEAARKAAEEKAAEAARKAAEEAEAERVRQVAEDNTPVENTPTTEDQGDVSETSSDEAEAERVRQEAETKANTPVENTPEDQGEVSATSSDDEDITSDAGCIIA